MLAATRSMRTLTCLVVCSFLALFMVTATAQEGAGLITLDTLVYYNPDGGHYYHLDPRCDRVHPDFLDSFASFSYGELFNAFGMFPPCEGCVSLDTQTLWFGEKEFREAWPVLENHISSLDILAAQPYAWRITAEKNQMTILVQDEGRHSYEFALALRDGQWAVEEPAKLPLSAF